MPEVPALDDIRAAAKRLAPHIINTPVVRFNQDDAKGEVFLKPENLQPIGAFKVRAMGNVLLSADCDALRSGVYTASSGNAGLGLAWAARIAGVQATVYAPDTAPGNKLNSVRELGAKLVTLPEADWWRIITDAGHPSDPGLYVDAVRDPVAMAGNATMGLEIVSQCPDVDTVIVPFGGGGVACGIAAGIRAVRAGVRIIVAESESAAPLTAAFAAGRPVDVDVEPSFVTGACAPTVLAEMWPLVRDMVDGTVVCTLPEIRSAVRALVRCNCLVAEGAGALPVAAAMADGGVSGRTVCVVTGGNIDRRVIAGILLERPA